MLLSERVSFDLGVAANLLFLSACGITMGECRSIISNNRHFTEERSALHNVIDKVSEKVNIILACYGGPLIYHFQLINYVRGKERGTANCLL